MTRNIPDKVSPGSGVVVYIIGRGLVIGSDGIFKLFVSTVWPNQSWPPWTDLWPLSCRARAWLRLAVMQKKLGDYFRLVVAKQVRLGAGSNLTWTLARTLWQSFTRLQRWCGLMRHTWWVDRLIDSYMWVSIWWMAPGECSLGQPQRGGLQPLRQGSFVGCRQRC